MYTHTRSSYKTPLTFEVSEWPVPQTGELVGFRNSSGGG